MRAPTAPPAASCPTTTSSPRRSSEIRRVTRHTATIGGRPIAYTATAGTLTIRDDDGKPTASFFYVAYTARRRARDRPVTFIYNGGPGSSSMWLHMGSLGPVRVPPTAPRHRQRALRPREQRRQPARQVRPRLHRRHGRGLFAPARRHQAAGVLGHRSRHRRLRARDRALPDRQRPLERAQVHLRRKLRHHALGGAGLPAAAGRGAAQRRGAAVLHPELRPPLAGLRPGAHQLHADLRGDRRLPPPRRDPPGDRGLPAARCATGRAGPTRSRWRRGRTLARRARRRSPTRWRPTRRCRDASSSTTTCASTARASARSCCATSGARWAATTRASPGMDADAGGERPSTIRPTPASRAPSCRPSTTT